MKKYLGIKIILALLPAILFTQDWAWMSLNSVLFLAFPLFWILMIWQVITSEDKNYIFYRLLWLSEIAFFILPLAEIAFMFGFGAKVVGQTEGLAQAGAAIGTAIGGFFAVGLGSVIGLFGGFVCRALAKKHEAKAMKVEDKKDFFSKNKNWAFLAALIILIVSASHASDKSKSSDVSNIANNNQGSKANVAIDSAKVCPEIIKSPTSFDFDWSNSTSGNETLFLSAAFVKQLEFGGGYELDNKPNVSEYFSDNFYCEKGSSSGESTNKLYCRSSFSYKPDLKKKNIDKDGNIINTEDKYIETFIFDVTNKDIKRVNDLKSLKIESIDCSNSSF